MIRTVVLLLIAFLFAKVSSDNDCVLEALRRLREENTTATESESTKSTSSIDADVDSSTWTAVNVVEEHGINFNYVEEPRTTHSTPSTVGNANSSPNKVKITNFEQLYLDLKLNYEQKITKLQIENDLLKKEYSTKSNLNAVHTIQTFCTCNVTDRAATNDCSVSQTDFYLEKVQEIHKQLLNITERIKVPETNNGCKRRQSDLESHMGESPVDWKQIPGDAVEISAKGEELWVIDAAQNIYRWDGLNWEQKPGAAVRVGSSPDGWTWIVNSNNNTYRWNVDKGNWDLMPGSFLQISAFSKDRALGVNRYEDIYLWSNNVWTQLPIGGSVAWVGIGDGDERWVINKKQQIYRWNHQIKNWQLMPGTAVTIDVQSPCRIIVTNASHQMFIWRNNNWQMLNGAGTRSSISYSRYYSVNSAQEIFIGN